MDQSQFQVMVDNKWEDVDLEMECANNDLMSGGRFRLYLVASLTVGSLMIVLNHISKGSKIIGMGEANSFSLYVVVNSGFSPLLPNDSIEKTYVDMRKATVPEKYMGRKRTGIRQKRF